MREIFKEIPNPIKTYLKSMDDYDDPCFLLINTDQNIAPLINAIDSVIDSEEIYSKESIAISDKLHFFSLDGNDETITHIVTKVHDTLGSLNIQLYQSAFRHNCLGEPEETFKWCCELLAEVGDEFSGNSGYKINDFKDRDNWPGIEKYKRKKDYK